MNKLILAIDTSCDETSVAVVAGVTVLSNVVASQVELHKPYGGVFPTVAKQAHKDNIDRCVALALKRAGVDWAKIDAIAVTQGPGLAPALEVGIETAKKLATKYGKPLFPINHIEGHVLSVLAKPKKKNQPAVKKTSTPGFETTLLPALSIIVSGGHTEFILITEIGEYQKLGWTIDDAAGEALDKVGRMLDLGYPAGPVIEEFAKKGNSDKFKFPLPMTTSSDYNLSFSGLKTFSRNLIEPLQKENQLTKQTTYDFCASFQKAVFRHISHKLTKILQDHPEFKQIWLGGGVAANITLRKTICQTLSEFSKKNYDKGKPQQPALTLLTPYSKKLCGDNAAMIGVVAGLNHNLASDLNFERDPKFTISQQLK
jgi:N6-L-threonylcarbamoyladenine synthase